MKLTTHSNDRWFTVQSLDHNQIGGKHWSLGDALETCVRHLNSFYSCDKLSIWEAEGNGGSSTQTLIITVFRNADVISIKGELK